MTDFISPYPPHAPRVYVVARTVDGEIVRLPAYQCPLCDEYLGPTEDTINETAETSGLGDLSAAAHLNYRNHYRKAHT